MFGLTNGGREFVEKYLTAVEERPDSYELRVDRLEDEVGDLQDTVEDLDTKLETLLDRIEEQLSKPICRRCRMISRGPGMVQVPRRLSPRAR